MAEAPRTIDELLSMLAKRDGVWDRPDGDWVPGPATEARRHANSLYRLGSRALRRNELPVACAWLAAATREHHPGAVFRLAAASSRLDSHQTEWAVRMLVGWAAVLGHQDAVRLAPLLSGRARPSVGDGWEDEEFALELLAVLRGFTPRRWRWRRWFLPSLGARPR